MNKIFNSILLAACLSTNTACISRAIEAAIPQKGKQEDRVKQVRG